MSIVSIEGLNPAAVLAALYNASRHDRDNGEGAGARVIAALRDGSAA